MIESERQKEFWEKSDEANAAQKKRGVKEN
jgi:hypothetical protein